MNAWHDDRNKTKATIMPLSQYSRKEKEKKNPKVHCSNSNVN